MHSYISKLRRRAEAANEADTHLGGPVDNTNQCNNPPSMATYRYGQEPDTFGQPAAEQTNNDPVSRFSELGSSEFDGRRQRDSQSRTMNSSAWTGISSMGQQSASSNRSLNNTGPQLLNQSTSANGGGTATSSFPEAPPSEPDTSFERQDEPSDFYGGSSTLSYIQAMQHSIETGQTTTSPSMTTTNRLHPTLDGGNTDRSNTSNLHHGLRPSRPLADELVASYFRHVHVLYPFLHRPTFQVQYEKTWDATVRPDEEWLALLHLVFALGIRFGQVFGDETTASDEYFAHARGRSSVQNLAKPKLQTLQLLLLEGLYYQFTNRTNENWNAIGLAIRIAMMIGAHVNPPPGQYNAIVLEVRRRCWHVCIVLDSYVFKIQHTLPMESILILLLVLSSRSLLFVSSHLALNLGRPTAIPDDLNVTAPTDLDDEYITAHGYAAHPPRARSRTAFFVQVAKFCAIMKDVQRTLYPQNSSCHTTNTTTNTANNGACGNESPALTFGEAVRLDKRLLDWYQNVPGFLKCRAADEDDSFDWIRNVLLCR